MTQIYKPTFFIDDAATAARGAEVPGATFNSGCYGGASNSPGIGINVDGGAIVDEPQQFTVLDQFGNARQAQIGQCIGGSGFVDRVTQSGSDAWPLSGGDEGTAPDSTIRVVADSSAESGGVITLPAEGAWLTDAATGWVEDPTP
jgi:hypothetical protein